MNTFFLKAGMCSAGIKSLLLGAALCLAILPAQATDLRDIVPVHPSGGERCTAGSTYTITWDAKAVQGNVDILLWNAERAEWSLIASNVASAGSFDWLIAPTLQGEKFRIKVESVYSPQRFQISTTFFYIVAKQSDAVTGMSDRTDTGNYSLLVYPSPASDVVYITSSDGIPDRMILRNNLGQVVTADYSITGGIVTVEAQTMASGVYTAEIQFRNGTKLVRPFVISR